VRAAPDVSTSVHVMFDRCADLRLGARLHSDKACVSVDTAWARVALSGPPAELAALLRGLAAEVDALPARRAVA
jgi:hypothetical protein